MNKTTHYELYLSTIPPVAVSSNPVQSYEVIQASPFRDMDKGKAKVVQDSSDEEEMEDHEIDKHLADYDSGDEEEDLVVYGSDEEEEEEEQKENGIHPPPPTLSEPVQKIMNSIEDYSKHSRIDFSLLAQDLEKMYIALGSTPPRGDALEELNERWVQHYRKEGCAACVELLSWLANGFEQLKFKFDQRNEGENKLPEGTLSFFTEVPIKDTYHTVYLFAHQNLQPNGRFLSSGRMERKVCYLSPVEGAGDGIGGDDLAMIVWSVENFYHAPHYLITMEREDALRWYVSILMIMEGLRSSDS